MCLKNKTRPFVVYRWIENRKPVEHFLGIIHTHEVNSEALTQCLVRFLHDKGISVKKVCGLGFDEINIVSGQKSGVQMQMRCHSLSALFVQCQCHQLQLCFPGAWRSPKGLGYNSYH